MPGRVLIADDLATNRIVLKVKLAAASYQVSQAANAAELRESILAQLPDLIILDGNFQGDRGIDTCQDLKENPQTATIPVMIIASDFTAADRMAALHAGASEILTKPMDDGALLARVRNSMRVRGVEEELRNRESTAIELGFQEKATPFTHPAQVLVVNGDQKIDLSWQEPFKADTPCSVHMVSHDTALDAISRHAMSPDLILISANASAGRDGLFILAELRSRANSQHAAIVLVGDGQKNGTAFNALDLGANEIIDSQTPPAEFAFRLGRQLRRKRKADKLRDTLADGLRLAVTDPLTGLFNRRYAFPHMSRIAQKSKDTGSPFAVMVLDLDRFKQINDKYGHATGDQVLKEVARRLKSNLRSVDLIARIGGEEFLVVMPETDLNAARLAAERLRKVTEATPISIAGNVQGAIAVTTSIGVSIGGMTGQVNSTVETMVERADQALLGAKSTGRNQVIFEQSAA